MRVEQVESVRGGLGGCLPLRRAAEGVMEMREGWGWRTKDPGARARLFVARTRTSDRVDFAIIRLLRLVCPLHLCRRCRNARAGEVQGQDLRAR